MIGANVGQSERGMVHKDNRFGWKNNCYSIDMLASQFLHAIRLNLFVQGRSASFDQSSQIILSTRLLKS